MPQAQGKTLLPQTQLPETNSQSPPVQNTWYEVINEVGRGIIHAASIVQDNDENAAKNCQLRITVDGTIINLVTNVSIADNAVRYWYLYHFTAGPLYNVYATGNTVCLQHHMESLYYRESILIEMRMTSVVGTNQTMEMSVAWSELG